MANVNFAGAIADMMVSTFEADKTQVLSLIAQGEGDIKTALASAIASMPKPGGMLGMVFPMVEKNFEAYAETLLAKYGPDIIFAFLDTQARAYAAKLGG